jgi:hypothetical protein
MADVLGLDSLTIGEAQPATVTLPFDDEQAPPTGAEAIPDAADEDETDTDETVH